MRSLAVFLLVLSLLIVGTLVWTRGGEEKAHPGEHAKRTAPGEANAVVTGTTAPSRALAAGPSAPSLRGTGPVNAPEAAPIEPLVPLKPRVVPLTPPPGSSIPERIAQVLHDGTRIERLWAEYAQDRATPETRRMIQVALARLANAEEPSFWAAPPSSLPGKARMHMRVLRATPGLWRDIGCDTRCLSHLFLDDTEVEIIERVLANHGDLLRVEDERRLSVSGGRYQDVFLHTIAPWPRLADGRSLPLGTSVRVLPILSEDRRFVTLRFRLRMAVPVAPRGSASPVGSAVRMSPDAGLVIPDGGTALLVARSVLCGLDGSASSPVDAENEATRYMLMLHVALE